MPPQAPPTPVSSPLPNPQYDFILRDPQKPRRSIKLPKPVFMLVGLVAAVFILIIVSSLVKSNKASKIQPMIEVVGRAQEIARVSGNIQSQSNDPYTQYLAATTQITFSSEQYQLSKYLASHGTKITTAELLVYKDSKTDTLLQTAQQYNNLEPTYDAYLKTSLIAYQNSLKAASAGAPAARLAILNDDFASTQVLLAAPEIAALK